jgi:hypothetical protein
MVVGDKLASDFAALYSNKYPTVGAYYQAHKDKVIFEDLVPKVPGLKGFVGLSDVEDETA